MRVALTTPVMLYIMLCLCLIERDFENKDFKRKGEREKRIGKQKKYKISTYEWNPVEKYFDIVHIIVVIDATNNIHHSPMVGAKFEIVFRIDFFKYTDWRSFFRDDARTNVVVAHANDRSPLVKLERGDVNVLAISDVASTTKIQLIRTEKISSVNRVKYLTKLDPDVMEETNK